MRPIDTDYKQKRADLVHLIFDSHAIDIMRSNNEDSEKRSLLLKRIAVAQKNGLQVSQIRPLSLKRAVENYLKFR